jgi:hypothetical protein
VLGTIGTALALMAVMLTIRSDEFLHVAWEAFVFALPASVVVARGHLGRTRWQVPTPGAFVFFLWVLGIVPTLFEWTEESVVGISFSPDAVVWSRIVAFAWFALFAIGLGPAPENSSTRSDGRAGQWLVLGVVLPTWAISAAFAAQAGHLSYYGSLGGGPAAAGSLDSAVNVWYVTLTPLIMPLGTVALMSGSRRMRALGALGVALGATGIFVLSERRLAVVCIYLCLFIVQSHRSSISWRWVVSAFALGWFTTGPLVMLYRGLRGEESSTAGAVQQAWQSVAAYATDERARMAASRDASDNVRTRLGASTVLFLTTDHALEYGPNLSPSPLEPVVRFVPSFVWPSKNEVADSLSVELQVCALPGIHPTDFGLSPIAEFVFQFGPWAAPLGGILYGLACRLANAMSMRSASGGTAAIAWLGYVVALSYFDAGTSGFAYVREPLVLATILTVLLALFRGRASRVADGYAMLGVRSTPRGDARATRSSTVASESSFDIP